MPRTSGPNSILPPLYLDRRKKITLFTLKTQVHANAEKLDSCIPSMILYVMVQVTISSVSRVQVNKDYCADSNACIKNRH